MTRELVDALAPPLSELGVELVDVEVHGATLRVTVDRSGGIDLDGIAGASRVVSQTLDMVDPLPGRYTLEVSSPGLERRLRTPAHFARAVGAMVSVRMRAGAGGADLAADQDAGEGPWPARRLRGQLSAADEEGFTLEGSEIPGGKARVRYSDVERARTVFEWGSPGPGADRRPAGGRSPGVPSGHRDRQQGLRRS